MGGSRALALASVPAAAGLAWRRYRQALHAVESQPVSAPHLPGLRHLVDSPDGVVAYRSIDGRPDRDALVLIHGWGKTADAAWWPLYRRTDRTLIAVDLPGHGASPPGEFSFELASRHVQTAIHHAGLVRPVLVAHSMGGPVALAAIRRHGPDSYAGLLAIATSAYWVRPRLRVILALAPYAMAPRSPVLLRTARADFRHAPHVAEHIAWSYTRRPHRRVLDATAVALRRFDARRWTDLSLPPSLWVVAGQDNVLAPEHQMASARHLGASVTVLDTQHSAVVMAPDEVASIVDRFAPEGVAKPARPGSAG